MATLSELIKGFRANVRNGIPTTLYFSGKDICLIWFQDGTATLQDARSPEQARILVRGRGISDPIAKIENLSN